MATGVGLAAAVMLTTATGLATDFRAGRSAFDLGDYATAVAIWTPLARNGEIKSQASLGYLHLNGLGVDRDVTEAARWYDKAARQGQPEALYYLGALCLDGRGVARDYGRAYVACGLAMLKGVAQGMACRDAAAAAMTENEIDRAERRVSELFARDLGD